MSNIELIQGRLYRLRSRNLPYGVYDGAAFTGIREKFGHLLLDTEYPGHTATAIEDLEEAPREFADSRALFDYLADAEQRYGRGTGYGGRPGDPQDGDGRVDTAWVRRNR